ncbi:hypothetical protein D918_07199 [Trichuris suis]|nr:hypothetical protein D918_07199 [Trichuris suis]
MQNEQPKSNDDVNDPVALKKYQPHSQSSRVLRVSDFPENVAEADLIDALSQFGAINYVSMVAPTSALVEFEDQAAAERCIAMTLTTDVLVAGKAAFFAYANMRIIPRQGVESDRPSNVLVMYVQNVKYPITTDVIHQICKAIAVVNRIIISRRDGVHALVEFPDIEAARAAKQRLNGCDIYANCCTLKIEFAKVPINLSICWEYGTGKLLTRSYRCIFNKNFRAVVCWRVVRYVESLNICLQT